MKIVKSALVVAATALMTSPAWALPAAGTGHPSHTVPAGPPPMTPNNTHNPGHANRAPEGQKNDGERGHRGHHAHNGSAHGGSNQGGDHNQNGNGNGQSSHPGHSHPGHSHRCMPHEVAYVAAGTLLNQTLSKDGGANTYSGNVEVAVQRTNRHAAAVRNTKQTYTVAHVRVTFALHDVNHDGSVGLDDVQTTDRVKLIGKVSALAKRCDQSGFAATVTIAHIVLHPPAHS